MLEQTSFQKLVEQADGNFLSQIVLADFVNAINKKDKVLTEWADLKHVLRNIYFTGLGTIDPDRLSEKQKSFVRRFRTYGDFVRYSIELE